MKPTPETDAHQLKEHMAYDRLWSDFARKLERERDESRASNAELLERLRERTESHIAASARDVQDNQQLRVANDAMREAIKETAQAMENLIIAKRGGMQPAMSAFAAITYAKAALANLKPFIK